MEFILVVTLLVLGLGMSSALLPLVAFRSKFTRPFSRHVPNKRSIVERH
jgi:hypothetical protein